MVTTVCPCHLPGVTCWDNHNVAKAWSSECDFRLQSRLNVFMSSQMGNSGSDWCQMLGAGRLAKSTQQAVLLDGRQLGPLCHLAALRLPPKGPAKVPADDAARQLFFQVIQTKRMSAAHQGLCGC